MQSQYESILQQRFPDLLQLKSRGNNEYHINPTEKNLNNLVVHNGEHDYNIYEQTNLATQVNNWAAQFEHVKQNSHVIFFGIGLGYHITAFRKKHPEVPFSIFEPSVEIMSAFIDHEHPDIGDILCSVDEIILGDPFMKSVPRLSDLIDHVSRIMVVIWPPYAEVFTKEVNQFNETLRQLVNYKQQKMQINHIYEKEWALNSIHNFSFVLNTPNFLQVGKSHLQGKPVVLVAAGPSLNDEIENLRTIKNERLAYIFSVGSAVNALIEHGIYPHGTFSYDPNPYNVKVVQKVIDLQITTIPLIFGSTVGRNTVDSYTGPKMHVIISQDELSRQMLRTKSGEKPTIINDAPSVAVIALQCLVHIGVRSIILVGQNFAYRNKQYYAAGVTNASGTPFEDGLPQIEGVTGEKVVSNPSFIKMKKEMEFYIHASKRIEFINTTIGGALIEGTKFMPLDEVIKLKLDKKIGDSSWLFDHYVPRYDISFINRSINHLETCGKRFEEVFEQIQQSLYNLAHIVRSGRREEISSELLHFDDLFADMISNPYFKTYLLPRYRMEYEFLYSKMDSIKNDRNEYSKAQKVLQYFGDFVWRCQQDYSKIKEVINRFQGSIVDEGDD